MKDVNRIPKSRRLELREMSAKKRSEFNIRVTDITKDHHPCFGVGHEFCFAIRSTDRYGYCEKCGDETLT